MIGCGSIGQGLLPVLFCTSGIASEQLTVIAADETGRQVANRFGVRYLVEPLTPENHQAILSRHLRAGDLLLNLSVNVSSVALIAWCKSRDVLYLDTCVEPWSGGYVAGDHASQHESLLETTNAWLRRQALALHSPGAATAVIAHGMNPGLVSHLLKEALLALARTKRITVPPIPSWGELAQALGVKVVHIAERDTQGDGQSLRPGEFANTWSAEGLYSEAWLQRAEMTWGTHENALPIGAHSLMQDGALCLAQRGADIFMRSWLPSLSEQQGMLVTHHEVISIAAMLSVGGYRPSVCYVYSPCPKARESLANLRAGNPVGNFRVLASDAVQGFDEVGVLLVHDTGALWHGSTLTSGEAHRLAAHNSATSLQVVAGIIGALAWMMDHPREGVVEAETMDSAQVLAVARPYLGTVSTVETAWRPGPRLTFDEFLIAQHA
ncbi:MAG TPA: saccharopine dehydrogenase NADP-binding domain-containing protein [Gallionella sp.]|nr:saccharopine dehydrogenase NADP-binding domain-containing protein [Gallionella sp.]